MTSGTADLARVICVHSIVDGTRSVYIATNSTTAGLPVAL